MKVVIATILILITFFAVALYMEQYVNQSAEILTSELEKLEQAIEKEEWKEVRQHMENTAQGWGETKKVWLTFLEHNEIDKIDIVFARLQSYVGSEENVEALSSTAELKFLLQHIVEKQGFRLTNVL
ncbi:protein of unknown function [Natronincola peptidivorans]|uniref:DUF4363 family protein n=1 Tax=Natronincola peptidivorans TaxID=426128 RepID=A0A1I0G169_9FIRM|nr:DUF4363 family protein [Natronincola peptidivorans]SET63602.1 protein of unknown function [Natronincola peptidivorans]